MEFTSPLFGWLYLPAFFLQEGERGVLKVKLAAGGGG